jgi:hypothetical protein
MAACDILPRGGDTHGEQLAGRWDQHGRLIVETDDRYTLVRLRVDTTGVTARHDIVLARFDFGDQYALTIGLELGDATQLAQGRAYRLGAEIPATATVACLCRPLRPDSVRGTYTMTTRGGRQIAGRIDATLYFTAWDDSTVHTTYRLQQPLHGVRP